MKRLWAIFVGLFSLVYILNPTFGIFEFIPDNVPWIGNLDEATAAILLVWAIKQFFGKADGTKSVAGKPPEKTVY